MINTVSAVKSDSQQISSNIQSFSTKFFNAEM